MEQIYFFDYNLRIVNYKTQKIYFQINNLKISNEEFNQLPRETLMELEQIISKSLNP